MSEASLFLVLFPANLTGNLTSCIGYVDFPQSVYSLWCFSSFSKLLIPPLVHPFINLKMLQFQE